jgi:hypothetical protein
MSLSDYLENAVINWVRGTTMPAAPATIYVALFTADPGETGVFTNEVAAATGYARTAVTLTAPPSPVSNSADVVFPTATASWGTITHAALVDSATRAAGNVLASNTLGGGSQAVGTGITPRFVTGQLTFTLD